MAFVLGTYADRSVRGRVSRSAKTDFVLDPLEQLCVIASLCTKRDQFTIRTAVANICAFGIPHDWPKLATNYRRAASLSRMKMPSPRRVTVFTKPNAAITKVHGAIGKIWKWPLSAGSIGSTTGACWDPSEIFPQPLRKRTDMHTATCSIWWRRMKL